MDLNRVSIGIKTFLRDGALFTAIAGIRETMPEVKMIIADCGEHTEEKEGVYIDLIREGHTVMCLPFDAGFGAMSNAIADALDRPYLLIGSDDFDFRPPSVRRGIERMAQVLDIAAVDIVGGRVHGAYEFNLEDQGDVIIEHRINTNIHPEPVFIGCDLTVNYILMRAEVLKKIRWDSDVRIGGGEHGAWFVDAKRAGFRVAYVPGVEISEQQDVSSPQYMKYRARSGDPSRPCFDRRGIRKYVLGTGQVDYEAPARS
jgi:hypothetical protein